MPSPAAPHDLNHEIVELHGDSVGIESLVIQRSLPDTITLWARTIAHAGLLALPRRWFVYVHVHVKRRT